MVAETTGQKTPAQDARVLSNWQTVGYGFLSMPTSMVGLALVFFLPTFYATEMGLGLTAVGIVFAAGRILDVITDPIIGNLSDETRSRWGARKPWIVLGTPLYCVTAYALLAPPDDIGLVYLIVVSSLYLLAYTIVDLPYSSIGLELSPHLHERSYMASSRSIFAVAGAIAAAMIPAVFGLGPREGLSMTAMIVVALTFVGLALLLVSLPRGAREVAVPRQAFWTSTRQVLAVPSFKLMLSSFLIIQIANALTAALLVLYLTTIAGTTAATANAFTGLVFLASALFLPLWIYLSKRWNKKISWVVAILCYALTSAIAAMVGEGSVIVLVGLVLIMGACFGADAIMPTSMLADIVYDFEQRGENRLAGVFLALKNSVSKLAFIVPMGVAFPVLDAVGFDQAAENGPVQAWTLIAFFAGIPMVLRLIAAALLLSSSHLPHQPGSASEHSS